MTSRSTILICLTVFLLLCPSCTTDEEIIPPDLGLSPLGADDPDCINGFIQQMPRLEDFFIQGELNGEPFDLDFPFYDFPNQCGPFFHVGGVEFNKCGLVDIIFTLDVAEEFPSDISRIDNPKFALTFNFGPVNSPISTPPFDSLITSGGIDNFVEVDFLSADSTIIEGTFEIHAIKKSNTFSRETEPEEIIIRNGIFRLQNVCE